MKLKLDPSNPPVTILGISETVAAKDYPVLKAGINKLIQAGKKTFLLDLTGIEEKDRAASDGLNAVARLPGWAHELGVQLFIASPFAEVGNAATREEALALISTPLGHLIGLEAKLKLDLAQAEQKKAELDGALKEKAEMDRELVKLRRERSDLQIAILRMEEEVEEILKVRLPPFESELSRAKDETLKRTLVAVLSGKEGAPA